MAGHTPGSPTPTGVPTNGEGTHSPGELSGASTAWQPPHGEGLGAWCHCPPAESRAGTCPHRLHPRPQTGVVQGTNSQLMCSQGPVVVQEQGRWPVSSAFPPKSQEGAWAGAGREQGGPPSMPTHRGPQVTRLGVLSLGGDIVGSAAPTHLVLATAEWMLQSRPGVGGQRWGAHQSPLLPCRTQSFWFLMPSHLPALPASDPKPHIKVWNGTPAQRQFPVFRMRDQSPTTSMMSICRPDRS